MFKTLKSWLTATRTATRTANTATGETMNTNPNRTNSDDTHERSPSLPKIPRRQFFAACGAVAGSFLVGGPALAGSSVKMTKWAGKIAYEPDGISPFTLEGTASHLGRFTAYGEVEFLPNRTTGGLDGEGVVAFEAANGDLLVGVLSWDVDARGAGGRIHTIRWRDSVELGDGTVVWSTGRFEEDRPAGVVSLEYLILGTFLALSDIVGVVAAPAPKKK